MGNPAFERFGKFLVAIVAALLLAGGVLVIDRVMERRALAEADILSQDDAAILAAGLRSELDKFSLMPVILAEDPEVAALLSGKAGPNRLNRRLEALARQSNAAAIYLTDPSGLTLAASNWNRTDSFLGANYGFRHYFHDAIINGAATQFALGTVSRRPGLYIAKRVGPADAPLGVLAVKVEFDALEAAWRTTTGGVYVTDADGVVLLASNPRWRFRAADKRALSQRDRHADRRQFGIDRLELLQIDKIRGDMVSAPLLDTQHPVALDGWTLHLLVDPSPLVGTAVANGRLALLLLAVGIALIWAAAWFLRRRRAAAAEAVLAERTRTLREQLSQANRLATLGQVTAGVSHEISQPIAAVRVFAENGQKLIKSGKMAAATINFSRIVDLTDRMGSITDELRRFSRRQPGKRRSIPVGEIIEGALLLLRDRIAQTRTEVTRPSPELEALHVRAEHVRLEQVLVNLLQNALDATETDGVITIAIVPDDERLSLSVRDSGPGVAPDGESDLFQPFATTKPQGLGLGLVISRDIMRELDGELSYGSGGPGACFTMTIPRAK